ncbi:hypothetical protein FRC11_004673 [Ceratobasidium sp. 423]|nr:hypothetical protein FRC11_004673 [Ceratobasidium sp. 423]
MSRSFSRNNSLLPRLGGTGSPEYTIEFETGPASQQHRIRASESTIRWYNDLTSRKVQYLQLCKESAQYYAVITLEDGSIFQLKFAPSKTPRHPRNIIEGVGDVACPISDMKFIIAACLPLCQRLEPAQASHGTLFALALATIIARKCVDIKSDHLTGTGTPLDEFWRDIVSSTKSANQPLWEGAIVDSIRDQVRNWVFLQAREHVAGCLFRRKQEPVSFRDPYGVNAGASMLENDPTTQIVDLPEQRRAPSDTVDKRERTSAASVVAWLEFLGPKQVANCLALWDATWSTTWEKEWSNTWVEFWAKRRGENIWNVVKPSQFTNHIPLTTGRTSGKIARKIPIDTSIMFEFIVKMPSNSLLQWECEHAAQFRNDQEDREIPSVRNKEVLWFKSWRLLRYPNPPNSWCPSWELAIVMAWVLRWEKAVETGQKLQAQGRIQAGNNQRQIVTGLATASPLGSQEQLSNIAPHAGNIATTSPFGQATAEPQSTPLVRKTKYPRNKLLTVTRLLGQMKSRYLKRVFEQHRIANQADQISRDCQGAPVYLLDKVVDFAWDIAYKTPGSPESNLSNAAASAFHLAKKNFGGQVPNRIAALPIDKWEQVYKEAWEKTWKKCWREAWTTIMKETEKIVSERGIQEGLSCARDDEDRRLAQRVVSSQSSDEPMHKLEPTVILSPRARASLEIVESKMLRTDLTMDYRRCIPSIFVSLEQLYRELAHSGPVAHPKMEIRMFEEKPLLQAIAYAKSKTKALWDQKPEEERFQLLSHAEFQNQVKRIISDIAEAQSQVLEQSAVEWMAEVWQEVIAISSSIDKDFIPESNEPQHRFRTLPVRATTHHGQRVDTLNFGRESQPLGENQNRPSFIGRILNHRKTRSEPSS